MLRVEHAHTSRVKTAQVTRHQALSAQPSCSAPALATAPPLAVNLLKILQSAAKSAQGNMCTHVDAFLEELPACAFQAVLQHLQGPDFASLRLVSHSISTRAAAAPYITLRLSASTTREQLSTWARATRRLHHAPGIRIICCGCISPAVFDAAMELLSLRKNVRELHLVGAAGSAPASAPHAAWLRTIEPLNRLGPGLKTLVMSNLALADLAGDIAQLAAVGTQLEVLRLQQIAWGPSGSCSLESFAGSMMQFPASFSKLQELTLQLPVISPPLPAAAGVVGPLAGRVSSAAAAAALRQQQAAALVAAAAAVGQLQCLRALEITRAPDIWALDGSSATARTLNAEGAGALAASVLAVDSFKAAAAAAMKFPAASCLGSLDAYGSWLLLRLPQLQRLGLQTAGANWAATWDHLQQQQQQQFNTSAGMAGIAGPIASIKATYRANMPARPASPNNNSSSSSQESLVADFTKQLACYSPRPAAVLLPSISSLQLAIQGHQLPELQLLLASLIGLQFLKITLLTTSSQATDLAALVVAAAAAGGGRLRSLVLLPGMAVAEVARDTFLPLTAAAGGPGRHLRQLRLVGCFKTQTAVAAENAASSGNPAVTAGGGWDVLQQLDGLQELCIHQLGPDQLQLPVSCLPSSLEMFEGRRLHLSSCERSIHAAAAGPLLHSLHLQQCQLDDAGSLASSNMQQLTTAASSWPGSWQAAAAAWPCLTELTAWCLNTQQSHSSSSSSDGKCKVQASTEAAHAAHAAAAWAAGPAAEASEQLMLQMAHGFAKLHKLHVQHLPCLAPSVLRAVREIRELQHLRVSCAAAAGTLEDLVSAAMPAAAAAAGRDGKGGGGSSAGSDVFSLKSLVLHVPAGQMPSAGAAAVAPTPAAAAAAAVGPAGGQEASGSNGATWLDLQEGLLQHMPWASVGVVADQCLR